VGGAAACLLVTALVLGTHWWKRSPLVVLAVLVPCAVAVALVRLFLMRRRTRAARRIGTP
jgi:branched-subunit amino acid transport protein AzlD